MISYKPAPDIQAKVNDIIEKLDMGHVNKERVFCFRSSGSQADRVVARCHALGKIMQLALGCDAAYIIEVLSEVFDKMSDEEKTKTLIHELLHIPNTFGGGFKHHDYVTKTNIEKLLRIYKLKANNI